jgi:hypothetical protein
MLTKRNRLALLSSLAGLALAATPIGAQTPSGTTTVTFNGYCDGMTVTFSGTGSFLSGTHNNYDCNGDTTFIAGVIGQDILLQPNPSPTLRPNLADNVGVLMYHNEPVMYYLDFTDNSWAAYAETNGTSPESLLSKGTFTIVSNNALPRIGGIATWQDKAAPDDTPKTLVSVTAYPRSPYTISFSNHCDYFFVYIGAFQQAGGTHVNFDCGGTNTPFAGNNSSLQSDVTGVSGAGQSLIETDNESSIDGFGDVIFTYYFDFSSGTWTLYQANSSSGLTLLNSGSFTVTPGIVVPVPPPNAPSTSGLTRMP